MSTIVFFHAHPDDEASATAGSMSRASAHGDRVVAVYGTSGEHGDIPDDLGDETIVARRRRETEASAAVTGTAAVHWLGYSDSGMTGWEQNALPNAFTNADVDEAAARLVEILDAEQADVLVGYDWHGGYGHPDHIMVHRVARRAAELSSRGLRYLETTMNRDAWRRMAELGREMGLDTGLDPDAPADDGNPIGTPEAEIQWAVDVTDFVDRKRASLACHASQAKDTGMMLSIPDEPFAMAFGVEHYLEPGLDQPLTAGWPLTPLPAD